MAEELKSSTERLHWTNPAGALRELAPCESVPPGLRPLMLQAADEIDRLSAQWEKAARLLNEFRPVTGTDEWVAVRVSALNYVLMAASPTPAVGPLVPAPEPRDG